MILKIKNWTIYKAKCPICGQVVQACKDAVLMAHNADGEYIQPDYDQLCAGTDQRGTGNTEIAFRNRARVGV